MDFSRLSARSPIVVLIVSFVALLITNWTFQDEDSFILLVAGVFGGLLAIQTLPLIIAFIIWLVRKRFPTASYAILSYILLALGVLGQINMHHPLFDSDSQGSEITDDFEAPESIYKKAVLIENPKSRKEVGAVKTEFLNENNLYENYTYHYTIRLPKDYSIDYGISKAVHLQATQMDSGFIVAVSTGPIEGQTYSRMISDLGELEASNSLAEGVAQRIDSSLTDKKNFEQEFFKSGIKNARIVQTELTNYHNRKFIKMTVHGDVTLEGTDYPIVLVDYMTFAYGRAYHFGFRCWEPLNTLSWTNRIMQTMSTVYISDKITAELE